MSVVRQIATGRGGLLPKRSARPAMVIRKALRAASSPSPAPAGCALVRLSAVPGRVSPQAQINLPLAVFYHPIQRAAFQCRKRRRLARVFLAILQTSFLNLPRLTRRPGRRSGEHCCECRVMARRGGIGS